MLSSGIKYIRVGFQKGKDMNNAFSGKSIDFILCTVGRDVECRRSVESIIAAVNSAPCIEVANIIIVDQNMDDRVKVSLLSIREIDKVNIIHERVSFLGLSRARNHGLRLSSSDFVAFPDDDSEYSETVLAAVMKFFDKNSDVDFVTVSTKEKGSDCSLIPEIKRKQSVSPINILGCSFTFFFRRNEMFLAGLFDPRLGVGSGTRYGAYEEEDFVVGIIGRGGVGIGIPGEFVYHEAKESNVTISSLRRIKSYSGGKAYCVLKNRQVYSKKIVVLELAKPLLRVFSTLKWADIIKRIAYFYGFYSALCVFLLSRRFGN